MKRFFYALVVACGLLALPTGSADDGVKVVARPPDNPKQTSWSRELWPIRDGGKVVEVGKNFVTVEHLKDNTRVCYPAHTILARGEVMKHAGEPESYTLDDLVEGDLVDVGAVKEENGVTYCIGIIISKRPGGRLPPGRKRNSEVHAAWWERRNAIDDLHEFGIPLSEKVRAGMSSTDPEAKKSDAILAGMKKTPPEKIEKLDD
jgi:hypothetical protein